MKKILTIIVLILLVLSIFTSIGLSQHPKKTRTEQPNLICNCGSNKQTASYYGFPTMIDPLRIDAHKIPSDTSQYMILKTPDSFSWKNIDGVDWTTPTKHQKNCGSCWDFAALGAFESTVKIQENCEQLNPDFSEQYAARQCKIYP